MRSANAGRLGFFRFRKSPAARFWDSCGRCHPLTFSFFPKKFENFCFPEVTLGAVIRAIDRVLANARGH